MIISSTYLRNAIERYKKNRRENYSVGDSAGAGASAAFDSFTLIIAILFFLLEFLVLFFTIGTAVTCTQPGPERIVHIVLATVFTLPYMLLNSLFNPCTKKMLQTRFGAKSK